MKKLFLLLTALTALLMVNPDAGFAQVERITSPTATTDGGTGTSTTFTACSVVFAGTLGVYTQDNPNFCFNDTNNQLLMGDGTSANPSYSFGSQVNTGIYRAAANDISFSSNGSRTVAISGADIYMLAATPSIRMGASSDAILIYEAADTLAMRRTTSPQTFRAYNTFTNSTNYERGVMKFASNVFILGTEILGTGTARNVVVSAAGAAQVRLNTNATDWWIVNSSGHFLAAVDNSNDIGASGATRPRNLYLGSKMAQYNSVTTTGMGVPAIYGTGRSTAQTSAVASVAAYTVGAADGSFLVSANVLVTTATTHSFNVTVTYTDESNVSRTANLPFVGAAGAFNNAAITNVTGAGPYIGVAMQIRCKAATTITIATSGTFTTVTYNVEGSIIQVN